MPSIIELEHEQLISGVVPTVNALDNHYEHIKAHALFYATHRLNVEAVNAHLAEHFKIWTELQLVSSVLDDYDECRVNLP